MLPRPKLVGKTINADSRWGGRKFPADADMSGGGGSAPIIRSQAQLIPPDQAKEITAQPVTIANMSAIVTCGNRRANASPA